MIIKKGAYYNIFSILLLSFLISACNVKNEQSNDPDDNSFESAERGNRASEVEYSDEISVGKETLMSTLQNFDMLGRLYEVARVSDMAKDLEQGGPYTVLAPANIAFEKAKKDEVGDVPDNWSQVQLEEILSAHIIEGRYESTELTDTMQLVTINGSKIEWAGSDHLLQMDIQASNGIIHVIDTLLVHPN